MKCKWVTLTLIAIATVPLAGQKIHIEIGDRSRIVHLETALNHLTVIEVNEPVTMVAAGSPSFKVEWKENKVFVQPTEAEVATNLFIWTASQRLNYELEPAGAVERMDFAIDETPHITQSQVMAPLPPVAPSPADVLLAGKPVRMEASKHAKKSVEVLVRDVYESDGKLFIRYALRNQGNHPYAVDTPRVYALDGAHYPRSLYGLVNVQLEEQEATRLTARKEVPIPVVEGELKTSRIEPGQETVGVVGLRLPSSTVPTVLRLQFPNDGGGEIAAYLVR